jgi:hypothetical protein
MSDCCYLFLACYEHHREKETSGKWLEHPKIFLSVFNSVEEKNRADRKIIMLLFVF